jgi:hypothetical protein
MVTMRSLCFLLAPVCALLAGCGKSSAPGKTTPDGYRELEWSALIPPQDIDVLKRLQQTPIDHSGSMKAQQVGTFNTVGALDGTKVRIPGYIVPLEADDQGRLTEFFLVPFLGACIHVPPPPPNQIVYVKLPQASKRRKSPIRTASKACCARARPRMTWPDRRTCWKTRASRPGRADARRRRSRPNG